MDPDIWRKDMRRAKEHLGPGQILIASILGTPDPGDNPESLIADYTRCAVWSAEAGADVIEVHLAASSPFGHETATKLAPWTSGFALVPSIPRRVLDEEGNAAFEGREMVDIVGASTYVVCARQVEEMIAWRKAGAWDHAILAIGGITTVERARDLLGEGASVALVDTAAIFDPLFAVRFRNMAGAMMPRAAAKVAPVPARKVAVR